MPNGRTHVAATVLAAGASGPLLHLLWQVNTPHALAFTVGCAAGMLVSPDLDVRTGSISFALVRRSLRRLRGLGKVLAYLWQWFWQPYARIIPRHRHPLSHWPIIGTAGRLLYLFLIFGALYWALQTVWALLGAATASTLASFGLPGLTRLPAMPGVLEIIAQPLFRWGAAGLAFADALHTLMDYTWPFK